MVAYHGRLPSYLNEFLNSVTCSNAGEKIVGIFMCKGIL